MTLEEAVYKLLMDDDALVALVKRQIYRGFRSQSQELPCVTFLRVSTTPSNGAKGSTGTEHILIQVDCWARRSSEAREVAEAVKNAMDGWSRESSPSIGSAILNDERDDSESPDDGGQLAEFRVIQTWSIWQQA